jgi:hypothetical protein
VDNIHNGEELEEGGWMITVGEGLGEALSVLYMFKRLGIQDLVSFSEKFSIPGIMGRTNAKKGTDEANALRDSVLAFASDWVGITYSDDGSIKSPIEIIQTPSSGTLPQSVIVDYMDRMIATLVRGGDLSTVSRKDGVGSNSQQDETDALLQDDCAMISETLQTQLDRLVIRMVHGDETPAAFIVINPPSDDDLEADLRIDAGLAELGVIQDPADLAERYGREMKETEEVPVEDPEALENFRADQPRVPKPEKVAGRWSDDPAHGGNGVPWDVERKLRREEDARIDGTAPAAPAAPKKAAEVSEEEKARLEYERDRESEAMADFPEIGAEMKGKLPRPEDLPPGDPMRGEVQLIWDRFRKETRARDGKGRKVISPAGAATYFAAKGSRIKLDALREEMNEMGFDYRTPTEMLGAVYESLEGRRSWGTASRGDYAENYNPDQDRDRDGKWVEGGGEASEAEPHEPKKRTIISDNGAEIEISPTDEQIEREAGKAHRVLNKNLARWVMLNESTAKKAALADYEKLPEIQRVALAIQVEEAVEKLTGGEYVTAYRAMRDKDTRNNLFGASLSLDEISRGDRKMESFQIHHSQIMDFSELHPHSFLGNPEAFGHEREMILKPDMERRKNLAENYNPAQDRDRDGKWTDGGFSLETQTDEEMKAEEAVRKRRADMDARRAQPLTGSTGDLTADMFGGGETPLFDEVRNGPTREEKLDAEYLELAKDPEKNREALRKLLDERATAAGYHTRAWHGTAEKFDSFDSKTGGKLTKALSAKEAFFFTDDEKTAKSYAIYAAEDGPIIAAMQEAEEAEARGDWDGYDAAIIKAESLDTNATRLKRREKAILLDVYVAGDFNEFDAGGKTPQELHAGDIDAGISAEIFRAKREGKTGVHFKNLDDAINLADRPAEHYAVFKPTQIKSADVVTYDQDGKVVPLSRRFDSSSTMLANEAAAAPVQAFRKALAEDMQPIGDALLAAAKAGDFAAVKAAAGKLAKAMPDFMESTALADALGDELFNTLFDDETDT